MPNPTARDLQVVDPLLTNVSIAYMQGDDQYIADKVFPVVPVDVQGGKYPIYDKGSWLRSEARVRAPGTESAGGGWAVSSASFFCDIIAVHKDLDDPTKAVARSRASGTFNLEQDATRYVTQQCLLKRDKQWAAAYFTAGVWTTQLQGVAGAPGANQFQQWNVGGSTPIMDVKTQIIRFARTTGFRPNKFVIGPDVWLQLSEHAGVTARMGVNQSRVVDLTFLDQLLGLPAGATQVAWAIENTAAEGAADNIGFIFGKHALLAYAAPNPGLMTPSAGYTFEWTAYPGVGSRSVRIKNFRLEQIESDRIEGEYAVDPRIVAQDLGMFFKDAVA